MPAIRNSCADTEEQSLDPSVYMDYDEPLRWQKMKGLLSKLLNLSETKSGPT